MSEVELSVRWKRGGEGRLLQFPPRPVVGEGETPDPPNRLQEEPKKPQKESKRPQDAAPNGPQNIRRGPRTSEQQKCRTNFNTEYESQSGGMRDAIE